MLLATLFVTWVARRTDRVERPAAGMPEASSELRWVAIEEVARAGSPEEPSPLQEPSPASPATNRAATAERARLSLAARAGSAPKPEAPNPEAAPEPETPAPAPSAGVGATADEGPRMSLQELGIGPGNNPFLTMPARPPTERAVLNQRVQQMLQSGLAAHDQELGLGPEGPAVALVEKIVLDSPTQPNTSGLLSIRTDAAGIVTSVELLEASNETRGWQRIAEELRRELAKKPLRIPPGSAGVSMQLRVVSRVQLPSGADPGLAVEIFGQTVKEGAGDRSARISVLSPKVVVTEVPIPNSDGAMLPMVGFSPNVFALAGDLVDIGAAARRVVRAHLVALETHVEPAGLQ